MVTPALFKKKYPEYKDTPDTLVQAKLDIAQGRVSEAAWGDRADAGVMQTTAHLLAFTPGSEHARLDTKNNKTGRSIYSSDLEQMRREVTMGFGRIA